MKKDSIRLSQLSRFAGCGAKLPPSLLDKALCGLQQPSYPQVISDFSHAEDCGVYTISDELALVQTVDFFPPVCDDPWIFGRVAAANALSDMYAMGAKPITAVNIVCFPDKILDLCYLREMMEGALDALIEAETALVGGHSIRDNEVKFGFCINGTVHPKRIWQNNTWLADEALILTKPLGVGLIQAAVRAGMASVEDEQLALASMQSLNKGAAGVLSHFQISACTDITGFGLLGHLCEMAHANSVGANIDVSAVPILGRADCYAQQGFIPAGAHTNIEHHASAVTGFDELSAYLKYLLFDPQTSGGLLAAVPQKHANTVVAALREQGNAASIIGHTDARIRGVHV